MELPRIDVNQNILSDINDALTQEWLVTNGLGGYASQTILGINTRKYHGLLVAAFNPPVNRWVLLSKLDESIQIGNNNFDLSSNEFRNVIYPKGYSYLSDFSVAPFPTFRYYINGINFQKTLFMPYMKNAIIALYDVFNPFNEKISVNVSPLVNSRHIYTTTNKKEISWSFAKKRLDHSIILENSDSISYLILSTSELGSFIEQSWWVEKMLFRVDASRGENSIDDSFRPGFFTYSVNPKERKKFYLMGLAGKNSSEAQDLLFSLDKDIENVDLLYKKELDRHKDLLNKFGKQNSLDLENWLKWLVVAADSFIVYRASTKRKSVLAGYHWFDDWGRDSLISLPGLSLVTGRFEDAKQILLTFAHYCSKGIVPNRFSDKASDIPLYNTVDATLWFFNSILQYLKYTGDFNFIEKDLWDKLNEIIENHIEGTVFDIHMEKDGLIAHGPQLTWMDATSFDNFVTPRDGKAVEIQALWYNALKIMELLAKKFSETNKFERFRNMANKVEENFVKKFWDSKFGCLFDVVNKNGNDSTLRPNQLIAVSLDYTMLDMQKNRRIVEVVWRNLWSKFGLKTLPKSDSRYKGYYEGNWGERDSAYHNGTVWCWLLGPFVTAFLKTKNHEKDWRDFAFKNFLKPIFDIQLYNAGLGTISEIFDGEDPHIPRGCISQAWSIAEPLRAYIEDVKLIRGKYEEVLKNNRK